MIRDLDCKVSANKWFLPLVWASDICARGLAEGNIRQQTISTIVGELTHIRENSDTTQPQNEEEGIENRIFEKEVDAKVSDNDMDDINIILDKKLLETISENQNSPYSTQASHNTSRRVSAQSLFIETPRRDSIPKEANNGPFMDLFNENEFEEDLERASRSRSESTTTESLSGSERSRESDVGSLVDTGIDMESSLAEFKNEMLREVSEDSAICIDNNENTSFMNALALPDAEDTLTPLVPSSISNHPARKIITPSPSLRER